MNPWRWVDPRIAQVRPAGVKAYLLAHGWTQAPNSNPQWLRFEPPPEKFEARLAQIIPATDSGTDFKQSMIYFLTTISEIEDRHPVEILDDVLHHQLVPAPRLATAT